MAAEPGGGGGGGGAPRPAAPAFRVQAMGLVKSESGGFNPVLNVLRGMCVRYETFERIEYGFAAPLQSGTNGVALRLFRHKPAKAPAANPFAPPPPVMWTLVHESTPMRGPVYAALPATVREVAETNLYTADAVPFLEGLGMRREYAATKNGNYYVCNHRGLEIQVMVYSATGADGVSILGKHWVLEATADAGAERQVEVAKLMGSFAERLLPHVELKRPA